MFRNFALLQPYPLRFCYAFVSNTCVLYSRILCPVIFIVLGAAVKIMVIVFQNVTASHTIYDLPSVISDNRFTPSKKFVISTSSKLLSS